MLILAYSMLFTAPIRTPRLTTITERILFMKTEGKEITKV